MCSCVFKGYVEETPFRGSDGRYRKSNSGYEFYIHLISIREDTRVEEKLLSLSKHVKIKAYCPGSYKEKEDDQYFKIDETLDESLIPSIHVGFLIEFRGTAYKKLRNSNRTIVIPQEIKTANEIEMDRHYIRIMPPNKESLKRYDAYVKAEKEKKKEREQWNRRLKRRSWIYDRIKDVKGEWVVIGMGIITIIVTIIVARC